MFVVWFALAALYAATGAQLLATGDTGGAFFLGLLTVAFAALGARSWKKRQAKRGGLSAGKKI